MYIIAICVHTCLLVYSIYMYIYIYIYLHYIYPVCSCTSQFRVSETGAQFRLNRLPGGHQGREIGGAVGSSTGPSDFIIGYGR